MTTFETILSDFPDRETVRELRFHLRSLQQDLAATVIKLQGCVLSPVTEPAAMWRLRETIADITAVIEHDARHHAKRALALVSGATGEGGQADVELEQAMTPSLTDDAAALLADVRAQLRQELDTTLAALEHARASVLEIAAIRGNQLSSLQPEVADVAETLSRVAWPAALRCLALTRALHRAADPEAAADEDRADELATPLRELVLAGARTLRNCAHCGAPLTTEDRTFDGSYCENCRTRIVEPIPSESDAR